MCEFWQTLEQLPKHKLERIYRYAKSWSVGQPAAIRKTTKLRPYVPLDSRPPFSDATMFSQLYVEARPRPRPSLYTFFKDPRDMIRLRELVRRKR